MSALHMLLVRWYSKACPCYVHHYKHELETHDVNWRVGIATICYLSDCGGDVLDLSSVMAMHSLVL